jgi:hypothetical protein
MGEGEERGRGFLVFAGIGLLGERRLTDFLVGVGKPQLIVSGSSALEAS